MLYCSGFILTAPKNLDSGSTEYLTFTAINVPLGGPVTIKLVHWHTQEVLAESKVVAINNMNMWVEMVVPPSPLDVRAKLQVRGALSGGHKIEAEKEVLIRHSSVVTFIQTDKPIYKPGQTVRFRVLPLDSQLKPLELNKKGDIWVQDPSDVRVAQWKQVKFSEVHTISKERTHFGKKEPLVEKDFSDSGWSRFFQISRSNLLTTTIPHIKSTYCNGSHDTTSGRFLHIFTDRGS
ncbi:hypothetical protein AVEN_85951-1 [Araneus ventricosus]|uniref:Macroglobulin domain-containing protein n=1 Tax=Araneus ventricosus TaxID=182803 RepID=A0A4Y2NWY3_ARAVE|nr:hypothetical protein AVEN_85951-1 [Araneus ventricosus]